MRIKDDQKDFINRQVEERLRQAWAEKNISISFEYGVYYVIAYDTDFSAYNH